jgi:hypothetical protein
MQDEGGDHVRCGGDIAVASEYGVARAACWLGMAAARAPTPPA